MLAHRMLFSGHLSSEAPCFLSRLGILVPSLHARPPDMAAAAILEIRCEPLDGTEAQLSVLYEEALENLPEDKNFLPRLFFKVP